MHEEERVKVWDIFVRIFHWFLVVLLFVIYFMVDEESRDHITAGYWIMGLIIFRFIWGFTGTKHARFKDFIFGLNATVKYVQSILEAHPIRFLGHNPLGGWMIIALLSSLFITGWSGLELYAAEEGRGPLASHYYIISPEGEKTISPEGEKTGEVQNFVPNFPVGSATPLYALSIGLSIAYADEGGEDFWEGIHGTFADITWYLILLHLLGVLLGSVIHRENLVTAMLTGYKPRK